MQTSPSFQSFDDLTISSDKRKPIKGSRVETSAEDAPFSHGFLDKDSESSKARALYFKVISGTLLLVCTYVIWGVFPIYWGSVYSLYSNVHNLHGWVVVSIRSILPPNFHPEIWLLQDLDGGAIGQTVSQAFISGSGSATQMTWMAAPSTFNFTTRQQFEHALVEEKVWAIVAST